MSLTISLGKTQTLFTNILVQYSTLNTRMRQIKGIYIFLTQNNFYGIATIKMYEIVLPITTDVMVTISASAKCKALPVGRVRITHVWRGHRSDGTFWLFDPQTTWSWYYVHVAPPKCFIDSSRYHSYGDFRDRLTMNTRFNRLDFFMDWLLCCIMYEPFSYFLFMNANGRVLRSTFRTIMTSHTS